MIKNYKNDVDLSFNIAVSVPSITESHQLFHKVRGQNETHWQALWCYKSVFSKEECVTNRYKGDNSKKNMQTIQRQASPHNM
jgi:hypothetical protein